MTEIERLQLSKRILTRIHASDAGCLSLDVIEREFNVDLYLLQVAVKALVESGLLEANKAACKDHPYNQMLILTPKGEHASGSAEGLKFFLNKKTSNRASNAKILKSLVANDMLREVLSRLNDKVQTNDHINYLVMQTARFHEIERAMNLNLIDFNSASTNRAQLRQSILNLIDELVADEQEEQLYKPQDVTFTVSEPIVEYDLSYGWKKIDRTKELLVLQFLTSYDKWYFSPFRIKKWGGKQDGFSELQDLTTQSIKILLESLFNRRQVVKTLSKKGNPIYKIKSG